MNSHPSSIHYNYKTKELVGEKVCQFCGSLERILPQPTTRTIETWHHSAECVVGPEPIR